jgi:hypothetical protein
MPDAPAYPIATCSSCGARIIWATTARSKAMPVDAEPVADGNIRLDDRGQGRAPLAIVVTAGQADMFGSDESRRTSHFATCPQADEHRRERR